MKHWIAAVAFSILMSAGLCMGQKKPLSEPKNDASRITGVWRAQTADGLPVFSLVVTNETGELTGAIMFYLLKREDVNHPWTSTPGLPAPIFHPTFDGKTLTFQVSHRHAHPPRTLSDPPVTFKLTPTEDDKAQFVGSEVGTIEITHSEEWGAHGEK